MSDQQDDPSVTSAAYDLMRPKWDKIDAVLGGTDTMRKAAEKYLPRHRRELHEDFKERVNRAVLHNVSLQTLDSWVGKPFSDPVLVSEDVDPDLAEIYKDVDLQGNHATVFARRWFREGLAKGLAHVLVDMPSASPGAVRTAADDVSAPRRPYWVFVRPENLIAARMENRGGREVLIHARVRETETVVEGRFGERVVQRIRSFDRVGDVVTYCLYEQDPKTQKWSELEQDVRIDLDAIPILTFYADRQDFMLAKPPLEDVVDLNVDHWQSRSDQKNCLTVARFPIPCASGVDEEDAKKIVLGPRRVLTTRDAAGRWYYLEHGGAALSAGRQDLLDLEEQMAGYGAEFLKRRPGKQTATARALDSAEATSPIEDAAIRFNDALAQAHDLTCRWLGRETKGTLTIPVDLGPETVEAADYAALQAARAMRDISRKTWLAELKRRGTLSDEFDPDQDEQELQNEVGGGQATADLNPEDQGGTPPGL